MEPVLLGEQPGNVLSPRPRGTRAAGYVAASPIAPALATALCSVLWGMPQGSWVFSSGPWAPAHLPEPRWWLSGPDIHPGNQGVGPQSRQRVLSPAGRGLTLSHRGWAPQYHVPRDTGQETRIPKEPGERPARSVSSESMLWEAQFPCPSHSLDHLRMIRGSSCCRCSWTPKGMVGVHIASVFT